MLIEPKEVEVCGKKFIISKIPAVQGRKITAVYLASNIPKLGEYAASEEIMLELMCFVGVPIENGVLPLNQRALVDNHVKDWEMLVRLEAVMMEYNCRFLQGERVSTFFDDVAQKLPAWISKMWMALSAQLSQANKPLSTNSGQSTP